MTDLRLEFTFEVIVNVANKKCCMRHENSEKLASLTWKLKRKRKDRCDQEVEKVSDAVQVLQRLG